MEQRHALVVIVKPRTENPMIKKLKYIAPLLVAFLLMLTKTQACSVLYYVDSTTGKIYFINNEDFWYNVNPYIQTEPKSETKLARLWYGWDKFAQGGINEAGLVFDVAVTPEQEKIPGYGNPRKNLGDELLAQCSTVEEALAFLEKRKIALNKSHMMLGDKTGTAVIVEWVKGERKLHWISGNKLIMTNYLLSDTTAGNFPCYRYNSIEKRIQEMEKGGGEINLLRVGNSFGQAGQPPKVDESGRIGGTIYTSFIDLTDMQFFLSYKLSNTNVIKLDLNKEFAKKKGQKIELKD